jgi:hypothetical protein
MPVFDLRDLADNITAAAPGLRVWATMIYPDDAPKRQVLETTLRTRYLRCAIDTPGFWVTNMPEVGELFRLLWARQEGPPASKVQENAWYPMTRGCLAGEVLWLLYWLVHNGEPGSVHKACYIRVEHAKQNNGRSDLTGLPMTFTSAKALLNQAWAPYKNVAHLWTAHVTQINARTTQNADGQFHLPSFTWFEVLDEFLQFLTIAESFRQFGEGHTPHAHTTPLLSPQETWRVPLEILRAPWHEMAPPLPEEYRQILATYQTGKMR